MRIYHDNICHSKSNVNVLASFNHILHECSLKMETCWNSLTSQVPLSFTRVTPLPGANSLPLGRHGPSDMRFFKKCNKFSGRNHPKGGNRWHEYHIAHIIVMVLQCGMAFMLTTWELKEKTSTMVSLTATSQQLDPLKVFGFRDL